MLRKLRRQLRPTRQLEISEIKPRRHRAPHQRKTSGQQRSRSKPATRRHYCLERLPRPCIRPQQPPRIRPIRRDHMYRQRAAGIKVPHLIRPQPMKCREPLCPLLLSVLLRFIAQQEVNCGGRSRPRTGKPFRQRRSSQRHPCCVRHPVEPTLRMLHQPQLLNPICRLSLIHPSHSPHCIVISTAAKHHIRHPDRSEAPHLSSRPQRSEVERSAFPSAPPQPTGAPSLQGNGGSEH